MTIRKITGVHRAGTGSVTAQPRRSDAIPEEEGCRGGGRGSQHTHLVGRPWEARRSPCHGCRNAKQAKAGAGASRPALQPLPCLMHSCTIACEHACMRSEITSDDACTLHFFVELLKRACMCLVMAWDGGPFAEHACMHVLSDGMGRCRHGCSSSTSHPRREGGVGEG